MLKRAGISARLNFLVGIFGVAVLSLVAIGYSAIGTQVTNQEGLVALATTKAAAQTVQYDFADFNGWQTAYAFDVAHQGAAAASDTAPSRKAFLETVARTRHDLATLRQLSASRPATDQAALTGVADGLDKFVRLDDQVVALYRRPDLASRKQADALVMGEEITIFNTAAAELRTFADTITSEQARTVKEAAASGSTALWLNVALGVAVLLLVVAISWFIGRSIRRPLIQLAESSDKMAGGDFDFTVDTTRSDEGGRALSALDRMKTTLTGLIDEMNHMSAEHDKGDIDVLIDADASSPAASAPMAQGVNDMVAGHIAVKKKAMAVVKAFGEGDFDAPLEQFPGKKAFINDTIEQVRTNLRALIADTTMLAEAARRRAGWTSAPTPAATRAGSATIVRGHQRHPGRGDRPADRGQPGAARRWRRAT